MKNNEFHASIRKIIEAKDQNKLVIFVGAGVSMNSGIPSWGELIDSLRNDLNISNENDFLKIPELYFRQRSKNEYLTKVRDVLKHRRVKYNELHKLIFDLKPNHIITTNYDDLLEQYANENGLPYQVIKEDHDLPYSNGNSHIIKMHGDLETGNIVLKESDYLNYSRQFPLIESYVKSLFASKLILFIGFSYSDYNLKFIMQQVINHLGNNIQPSYLIDLYPDSSKILQADYLRSHGISVLPYDNKINDIASKLKNESGRRLSNMLHFIRNYNEFEVDTSDLKIIQKLEKGFKRYSDFSVLVPNRIIDILKSININSHVDLENPHCLIVNEKLLKEFISAKGSEWKKTTKFSERIKLLEEHFDYTFTKEELGIITNIWERLMLSGVFYIAMDRIKKENFISLFDPSLFKDEDLDHFLKCDFIAVDRKINELKNSLNAEDLITAAFLSYKTDRYLEAYQLLSKASQLAWEERKYLKHYLCKYNIVKIKWWFRNFGRKTEDVVSHKIYNDINDIDLDAVYFALPVKDRLLVKSLIKDFLEYDLKHVGSNLTKSMAGDAFAFENHISITNKVCQTWNFINYNYLFGEHFDEYRQFYKNSFNEFLKNTSGQSNLLRRIDIIIAVQNLRNDEILEIIGKNKVSQINVYKNDLEELKRDFSNLISSAAELINNSELENGNGYSKLIYKLINNYLQIFSFIKFEDNTPEEILSKLFTQIFNRTSHSHGIHSTSSNIHAISESIHKLMINQHDFGFKFTEQTLTNILDVLIDELQFQEKAFIINVGYLLKQQNPKYKLPAEHFERRIEKNFISGEYIEVLIGLQPILVGNYTVKIKKSINKTLKERFNLHLFEMGINNNYIKYKDFKDALFESINNFIEHESIFPTESEKTYFSTVVLKQKIKSSDKELKKIIGKSELIKFWLDLDNFDLDKLQIYWTLFYNDTLFENHKKSKKIMQVKERMEYIMKNWDNSKNLINVYFKYFVNL